MADARRFEKLKSALGPAADCPPFDQLVRALEANEGDAWRKAAEDHISSCAHCRDEVAMLHQFADSPTRPEETRDVDWITRRLAKQRMFKPTRQRLPFFLGMRTWAAAACLFIVASSAVYLLRGPGEPSLSGAGEGVMRSQALELVEPVGDVRQKPAAFRWRAVPRAVRYQVRLMEVDHHEIWRGEATDNFISAPAAVLALVTPGKTLLWEVSAWDNSGKALGTSEIRNFRLSLDLK